MNMKTEEEQSKNMTEFGMRIARHQIMKEINNGCKKNLVISPLSLHIALNIIASASTGRTLEQFLRFLELDSITDLNDQSSVFLELATSPDKEGPPTISMVNGIWLDHHYPVKHSFKQLMEDVYKAKAESVDFVNQEEKVRDEVNTWASEASEGHIYPLLPCDFFKEGAIALLASAIYFNAQWAQKFKRTNTKDEKFFLLNGKSIKIPFMKEWSTKQLYGSFESFKLLKMAYKHDQSDTKKYAMYIFLPHEKDGLQELVEKFHSDPRFLLENRKVDEYVLLEKLWLPKVKYEYELNADESMKESGLDLPFDENKSEIKEMVETREIVYLSKVIQKSYIEIDEEGTIATAATRMQLATMACRNMPTPPPRPSFIADHPFLFMIKEVVSGIILFVGATLNPTSEEGSAGKKRKMKATKKGNKKQK